MESFEQKIFNIFQKETWEIKTLGEIAKEKLFSGNRKITQNCKYEGKFPAVTSEDIFNSAVSIDKCKIFVDESFSKGKKFIETGDLLILLCDFLIESLGKTTAYLNNEKCLAGNHVAVLKHNQNPKYLSYVFSTKFIKDQIKKLYKPSTKPYLNIEDIKQIKIPLPPIEIQNQIADFLDKFTTLKSEMEKEMKRRELQYEHYKELIFNRGIEELNWEIKNLQQIITSHHGGNNITKKHLGTGNYPSITNLDLFNSNLFIEECVSFVDENLIDNKKYVEEGDLIISDRSNVKEKVGQASVYLGKKKCLAERRTLIVKHKQNPRYLSYALSVNFTRKQMEEMMCIGIFSGISGKNIKKLKIPLPSLEEQNQIAHKLDKLHEIVYDTNKGIPKMIELYDKQYEYYKEKILNPL